MRGILREPTGHQVNEQVEPALLDDGQENQELEGKNALSEISHFQLSNCEYKLDFTLSRSLENSG